MTFSPRFTTTDAITAGLTTIERARGFLEAAKLSDEWLRRMSQCWADGKSYRFA